MKTLEMHPLMCGLTWQVLISTIYLSILSILSSISIRWSSATPPAWRRYRVVTGGFFTILSPYNPLHGTS